MAEDGQVQEETGDEPRGDGQVDWKARYEELVSESRKWEKRAKENAEAARELERLKDSQLSDEERRAKDAEELERLRSENQRYALADERRGWVSKVSGDTGVPAEVLALVSADSEEELARAARSVAAAYGDGGSGHRLPVVLGEGKEPPSPKAKSTDFFRSTLPAKYRNEE